MKEHHEEIFELYEKDIDFLLNEAKICSLNIQLDLQVNREELSVLENIPRLGLLYNAIKSKATSERAAYFNKEYSLYETNILLEKFEYAKKIKQNLDFFVRHFLKDVSLKSLDYTPIPATGGIKQTEHR